MLNGTTTRSPGLSRVTPGPTSSTMPIGSCPRTSPGFRYGPSTSYRCRSEPQMAVEVIRTIASVGSSIRGSGTSSTRTSRLPCQVSAFMPECPSSVPSIGLLPALRRLNRRRRATRPAVVGARPRTPAGARWRCGLMGVIALRIRACGDIGLRRIRGQVADPACAMVRSGASDRVRGLGDMSGFGV